MNSFFNLCCNNLIMLTLFTKSKFKIQIESFEVWNENVLSVLLKKTWYFVFQIWNYEVERPMTGMKITTILVRQG